MKKAIIFLFGVCIYLLSCGNQKPAIQYPSEVLSATETDSNSLPSPSEPPSKWEYSESEDKMTSKINYFAAIAANEPLHFKSPYEGATNVMLTLRKIGSDQDVILQISQGQFLSNIGDNRRIKVRFDDKEAMNFSYSDPSDYSSETIFINNESKFIVNVKKSKKLIIQCEFYDEGLQTMEFNVEGLRWER